MYNRRKLNITEDNTQTVKTKRDGGIFDKVH